MCDKSKVKPDRFFHEPNKQEFKTKRKMCHSNDKYKPFHKTNKRDGASTKLKSDGFFISALDKVKPSNAATFLTTTKTQKIIQNSVSLEPNKKVFDKKKWRLQKYSRKYKLDQWEDNRKKAVLREYYKQTKEENPKWDVQMIYKQNDDEDVETRRVLEENENNLNANIKEHDIEPLNNEEHQNTAKESFTSRSNHKNKSFKKANHEFKRIKAQKQQKNEDVLKKKAEKEDAIRQYKQKKLETYKKLNKKNKKGQPIMKHRMEILLEQIQNMSN